MNVLYITWDGPQTTYLEGLFLPIFEALARRAIEVHVLQLTWGTRERIGERAAACRAARIPYRAIRIVRRAGVVGQVAAIADGALIARAYCHKHGIDVVMPRGPLTGAIALAVRRRGLPRLVYEADGLPIDERVEFGGLPAGSLIHRVLRRIEARVASSADRVLCRTAFGRNVILERAGGALSGDAVSVVGNGRDARVFTPRNGDDRQAMRRRLGLPMEAPLVVYTGSLGRQYCLAEMAAFFHAVAAKRGDARLLVLTGEDAAGRELRTLCEPHADKVTLIGVPAHDVPGYLAATDLGLSFRAPTFSMRAVAPIKIGEYLLCGVPTLTSDPDAARGPLRAVSPSDADGLAAAAAWFLDEVMPNREDWRAKARDLGVRDYGLDATVERYATVLRSLAKGMAAFDAVYESVGRVGMRGD